MSISFATVDAFAPDTDPWVPVGSIASVHQEQDDFVLALRDAPLSIRLSVLSPTCLRVRFNPRPEARFTTDISPAVVERRLAPVSTRVIENSPRHLHVDAGRMRFGVDLDAFALSIYRDEQLVCADRPGYGLVHRPGQHGIASIKARPRSALYCGFGEKAGDSLIKNASRMTEFSFDNFIYARAPIPHGAEGGPLNPAEPLYASIPWLIEINPAPGGDRGGPPCCYGLFLDNVSQSFFDIGAGAEAADHYSFGALYGELDYYVLIGDRVADVLRQFTTLTGRSAMPPRYVFGYHQGCYGYYDRARLEDVARRHRAARIPLDGLHIDIDFQDNYRVFTHSEMKFPDAATMMAGLHAAGFKCSTVVTPLVSDNPLDERGELVPFAGRRALLEAGCLLHDVRVGSEPSADLFAAGVSYGADRGINPYPYPPLVPNRDGVTPLGARMNYPDLGRAEVRAVWSQQYAHLIGDLGIDMIWQDMMCPAAAISADTPEGTLPLSLLTHNGRGYVPHGVCHNAYGMFLLMATHDALRSERPEIRPFILARGGFAGLQRYAALWTGDNASSWDFLRITVPQILNLGLSGVPISGSDVGGFATGPIPGGTSTPSTVQDGRVIGGVTDPELFVRWMQAGAFLPWFRNHYIGYDKEYQEVYAYGEAIADICRRFIERRYRLLQVYYDAMYEWTQTGMPIVRPMFLNDPDDPAVYAHLDDQFFVGRDILVAPILFPAPTAGGPARRDVYLPAGSDWFAFEDTDRRLAAPLRGGQLLSPVEAALDHLPLYIRAGAIVPLSSRNEQYVGEHAENPLVITIFPGADGQYVLYQDDGRTTRAETLGAYRTTRISHTGLSGGRRVLLERLHDRYVPAEPFAYIRLLGASRPAAVSADTVALSATTSRAALDAAATDAYHWDDEQAAVMIKMFTRSPDQSVTVWFTPG